MDAYNEQMREQALAEYDERAARSEYYAVESFGSFVRFAVEHELEASDMAALIEKYGLYPQIVGVKSPDYTARRSLAWPIITFGAEKLVAAALGCTQKSLKECASEFSDYFGEASDELKERFDHMVEDEDLPRGMRLVKGSAGLPTEVAWSVSRPVAGAVSAACALEPAEGEEGPVYTWGVFVNGKRLDLVKDDADSVVTIPSNFAIVHLHKIRQAVVCAVVSVDFGNLLCLLLVDEGILAVEVDGEVFEVNGNKVHHDEAPRRLCSLAVLVCWNNCNEPCDNQRRRCY